VIDNSDTNSISQHSFAVSEMTCESITLFTNLLLFQQSPASGSQVVRTIDLHDCLQRFRQENQKLNNFLAHTYLITYMAIAAATASTTATA